MEVRQYHIRVATGEKDRATMASHDHKASLSDVARRAGVSAQTASRVAHGSEKVRQQTRERVQAAMNELGYRPSFAGRSLRGQRYRAVGLVMPNVAKTGNTKRLDGILNAAEEAGYAVTLIKPDGERPYSFSDVATRMATLPVDAMIVNVNRCYMVEEFLAFEAPPYLRCVAISSVPHPSCPYVDADQLACSEAIVAHLVERGHRAIRLVGGPTESIAAAQREQGFQEAMARRGLSAPETLRGDWSAGSGYEAGLRIADLRDCSAVYAANDEMALGVLEALRDCGLRVPQDVSLVGVDDGLSGALPGRTFTSVGFDDDRIGRLAFHAAVDERATYGELVPGKLVDRGSVVDLRRRA